MTAMTKDLADILDMEVRLFTEGKHISIAGKEQYREYIYLTYNAPASAALRVWVDWMYEKFVAMVNEYEHQIHTRDQAIAELERELEAVSKQKAS